MKKEIKKKGNNQPVAHCIIRNNGLFCSNCGTAKSIPFPIEIADFENLGKQFEVEHKDCPKTWKEPDPAEECANLISTIDKMSWWLNHGEHGTSSKTIYSVLGTPLIPEYRYSHPSDPDDFRRCYLLLKAIPEWRERLGELSKLSEPWLMLVMNWDRLTEMLEQMMKNETPNGMYEFMKELGC